MSKLEKKIELVKKYLPRCNSTFKCHTYGNIPREKFNNACTNYAGYVPYENVLGLIDETLFDSGKKGMLFTDEGVYASGIQSIMRYSDCCKFNTLPSSYNITVINELLEKLYEIETAPTGWDIAGSLFGAVFESVLSAITEEDVTEEDVIEEQVIEEDCNNEDETQLSIEEINENTYQLQLSSAQLVIEGLETMVSDTLICEEEELEENIRDIIETLEDSNQYYVLKPIDDSVARELETGNKLDVQEINAVREVKRFLKKIKFGLSAIIDAEDQEEKEEGVLEIKKLLRRFAKSLDIVSENIEKISKSL